MMTISITDVHKLARAYRNLSEDEKLPIRKSLHYLHYYLFAMWDPELSLPETQLNDIDQVIHILLAYKLFDLMWFEKLPDDEKEIFKLYIQIGEPHVPTAKIIIEIFEYITTQELRERCKGIGKPGWVSTPGKDVMYTTLQLFPNRVHL